MALNGVVNPLAMVGQDALWLETFAEDFGLDRAALLGTFFAGPTYQPWHWMGNLNGWGGPVDEAFLDGQLELQRNITARMASFGMKPVLPAFAGHVPKQMQALFPAANITQLAPWHGHMYASRAVQFHPHGGQFYFVWLSARTPHGAYVW